MWRSRLEIALVLAPAISIAWTAVGSGRFDLSASYHPITLYEKYYSHAQPGIPGREKLEGDWRVTPEGLSLTPGQSGAIFIRILNDHESQFFFSVKGQGGLGLHLALLVAADEWAAHEVLREITLDGKPSDLTFAFRRFDEVWLILQAQVDLAAASETAVISELRIVAQRPPLRFPDFPVASLLILTPALACVTKSKICSTGAVLYSLAVLCGLALLTELSWWTQATEPLQWWQLVLVQEKRYYFLVPYLLLLGLLGWHLKIGRGSNVQDEQLWAGFALGGVLVWSAHLRCLQLAAKGWNPLDPDAAYYRQLALNMASPYDTGRREPFWVWIIKSWFWVAGDSPFHLRLLTVLLSLLLIVAVYKFFHDYTESPLMGVIVAALVGVNPYLIELSVRGLREEVYAITILCAAYCVLVSRPWLSLKWRGIGLALAGTAAQLLRFNSYVFLLPLAYAWAWRYCRSAWYALLPLLFVAVVSVPHMLHNHREFDDPLYSLDSLATWSRNYEFVVLKRSGCKECPSSEEVMVNGYTGPPVTTLEYMLGMHSAQELMARMFSGLFDLYLKPTFLFETQTGVPARIGYGLYLLGLGLVLFNRYRELLLFMMLAVNVIPFFITMGFEARVAIHTVPFVSFVLAYGARWALEKLLSLLHMGCVKVQWLLGV